MDMKPDEIVVRYRQAKDKAEQLQILADLNDCTVDGIINVLCEHGGYKPQFFNKAKVKLKKQIPYKKPEIIPEPPKQEPEKETVDSALDILRAEIAELKPKAAVMISLLKLFSQLSAQQERSRR